jgi:beta-lactamase regulating signal transducer with metallopeptidase domain
MDAWVWIVVAIVAALLVIGVVVALAQKRKQEANRREAEELRANARHLLREADEIDPEADVDGTDPGRTTPDRGVIDGPPPEKGST